jgi:hypothetical protein
MKLGAPITEQKKVRCSGCGIVIVIDPHPTNPNEVITTIPKMRDKRKGMTDAQKKAILTAVLAVLALGVGTALYFTFRGPPELASADGEVTLDGAPLPKGKIVFEPLDTSKGAKNVEAPIVRGRYSARPWIGTNTVKIFGSGTDVVAERFSTDKADVTYIKAGTNPKNYETLSK